MKEIDLTTLSEQEQDKEVERLSTQDALHPFRLSNDLLLRVTWILLEQFDGGVKGVLLINTHHIAADDISLETKIDL